MTESSFHPPINRGSVEIRLLELLPGQKHDEISCNLFVTSLSEAPVYEALSYVWGNKDDTFDVLLCGKKFPALKSLQTCLTKLRYHDRPRILWIDSFCIDQNNDAERGHQVRLMAQIYRSATKVIAWIGDPHSLTLRTIHTLITCADSVDLSLASSATRGEFVEMLMVELYSFLTCSWWSRIWTLQEMILAHDLEFCWCDFTGLVVLSWKDLAFVCLPLKTIFGATGSIDMPKLHKLQGINEFAGLLALFATKIFYANGKSLTFADIAGLAQLRRCTDPRDKIYGLLGVVADLPKSTVDYTIPVTKVYEEAIVESIRASGSMKVLMGRTFFIPTQGMASWATDWKQEEDAWLARSTTASSFGWNDSYRACIFAPAQAAYDGQRSLFCAGRLYDEITTVFYNPHNSNYQALFASIRSWKLQFETGISETYIAGGTRHDAFWRTICGDRTSGQTSHPDVGLGSVSAPGQEPPFQFESFDIRPRAGPEVGKIFQHWWLAEASALGKYSEGNVAYSYKARVESFKADVYDKCYQKRMFLTKQGYIGVGQSVIQPGDHVAVLLGGERPFVVRPVRPGKSRTEYTYHGPCYVHGIMDGEAVEQLNLLPQPYPFLTLI